MAEIRFSHEKNQLLLAERGISFEHVLVIIKERGYTDIVAHPRRPHQHLLIFEWKGYPYYVPFVKDSEGNWFLKTIIPSRKLKKKYDEGNNDAKKKIKT